MDTSKSKKSIFYFGREKVRVISKEFHSNNEVYFTEKCLQQAGKLYFPCPFCPPFKIDGFLLHLGLTFSSHFLRPQNHERRVLEGPNV